jgi:hypothetical protein
MNNVALTVGDMLGKDIENFNPMKIDTSEIKELSDAMPKDGNIDLNNAEVLATKYLRGADMCSELLAIATAYVAKTDTMKRKAYSYAAMVKASEKNIKTDKGRAWFADCDDDYISASNKHAEAVAFCKWLDGKMDSFSKMHYHLKKILERGYTHERMSSFNGDVEKVIKSEENAW